MVLGVLSKELVAEFVAKHATEMALKRNTNGYPYKSARFAETKWRMYIDYSVWDLSKGKLVRKILSKIPGESLGEKRKNGKKIAKQITGLLEEGYILGSDGTTIEQSKRLSIQEAIELGAKAKMQGGGKRTQQRYKGFLNIFQTWLRDTKKSHADISTLGKKEIYHFLDWLKEVRKVGNRTRNNYAEDVRAVCNALIEREVIKDNPAKNIAMLPTKSKTHLAFTENEQVQLEQWLSKNDPRLLLFTRLIYYCFLRPQEICRMKVKDIDLKNRVIIVRAEVAKNRKQQAVSIPKRMIPHIEALELDALHPEFHFFSKKLLPGEKELIRNRVSERHRKALEESGLYNGKLTMYSWKHTGVCNAYRAGMDIKAIQQHLRHSSLDETEIYLRSLGLRMNKDVMDLEW